MMNKKAFSIVEYVMLFVIIIGAFISLRAIIQRGIFGNWAKAGQSVAFGRQYDSQRSIACDFDTASNKWYDHNCYVSHMQAQACNVGTACETTIISACAGAENPTYCTQVPQRPVQ